MLPEDALGVVGDFHTRSKHDPEELAPGPQSLEWSSRPLASRVFEGCSRELLPLEELPGTSGFGRRRKVPARWSRGSVSTLLLSSLALSGVKVEPNGVRFLRTNPSSGNLHPTEAYLVTSTSVYHYAPQDHALEERARIRAPRRRFLDAVGRAVCGRDDTGPSEQAFGLVLASACWREEWKYGLRAWRYCQLDLGHAAVSVASAAEHLGWTAYSADHLSDNAVAEIVGLDRPEAAAPGNGERETPGLLLVIDPVAATSSPTRLSDDDRDGDESDDDDTLALCRCAETTAVDPVEERRLRDVASTATWFGIAKPLGHNAASPIFGDESPHPERTWAHPLAGALSAATEKPETRRCARESLTSAAALFRSAAQQEMSHSRGGAATDDDDDDEDDEPFWSVARRRRTALGMDAYSMEYMSVADFFAMLTATLVDIPGGTPGRDVHVAVFAHRVVDVQPGLYVLLRSKPHALEAAFAVLQNRVASGNATWEPVQNAPFQLRDRLYKLLAPADLRQLAAQLSCNQTVAADGHFAVAFVADLGNAVFFPPGGDPAPWSYPRLHREAGGLGQVLYLASAKLGFAASGLGCFFDDLVHAVLGLDDHRFQSIYHLAVGKAILDDRLSETDPYQFTRRARPHFRSASSDHTSPFPADFDFIDREHDHEEEEEQGPVHQHAQWRSHPRKPGCHPNASFFSSFSAPASGDESSREDVVILDNVAVLHSSRSTEPEPPASTTTMPHPDTTRVLDETSFFSSSDHPAGDTADDRVLHDEGENLLKTSPPGRSTTAGPSPPIVMSATAAAAASH